MTAVNDDQIIDLKNATYQVVNRHGVMEQLTQTTLCNVMGDLSLDVARPRQQLRRRGV